MEIKVKKIKTTDIGSVGLSPISLAWTKLSRVSGATMSLWIRRRGSIQPFARSVLPCVMIPTILRSPSKPPLGKYRNNSAQKNNAPGNELHAKDYLIYAYLQGGPGSRGEKSTGSTASGSA